jgi:hypothetical protein
MKALQNSEMITIAREHTVIVFTIPDKNKSKSKTKHRSKEGDVFFPCWVVSYAYQTAHTQANTNIPYIRTHMFVLEITKTHEVLL